MTTFEDGSPAVADEVNANFQALINAINDNATRLAALESSQSNENQGFSGNYTLTGIGMATDCQGTTGNSIAITLMGLYGSGVAADGQFSFTLTEKSMDPILRDDGVGNFEVEARGSEESEDSILTFNSAGVFDGIDAGAFSEDGSTFTLTNSTQGCPGDVTYIHGVRI